MKEHIEIILKNGKVYKFDYRVYYDVDEHWIHVFREEDYKLYANYPKFDQYICIDDVSVIITS